MEPVYMPRSTSSPTTKPMTLPVTQKPPAPPRAPYVHRQVLHDGVWDRWRADSTVSAIAQTRERTGGDSLGTASVDGLDVVVTGAWVLPIECYIALMSNIFKQRFTELEAQLAKVKATKRPEQGPYGMGEQVDRQLLLSWQVKAQDLLERVCGKDSQHFKHFEDATKSSGFATSGDITDKAGTVFITAKEDYFAGYLSSARSLIQSEVFDSELEQATALLDGDYRTAAGVIAGTVLETSLRELCPQNNLLHGKLDKMNADLAKQGVYNANTAKRITAIAAIRNSAAHGRPDDFSDGDVKGMIEDIERFLSQHLV